jgi:hypothetical protein
VVWEAVRRKSMDCLAAKVKETVEKDEPDAKGCQDLRKMVEGISTTCYLMESLRHPSMKKK